MHSFPVGSAVVTGSGFLSRRYSFSLDDACRRRSRQDPSSLKVSGVRTGNGGGQVRCRIRFLKLGQVGRQTTYMVNGMHAYIGNPRTSLAESETLPTWLANWIDPSPKVVKSPNGWNDAGHRSDPETTHGASVRIVSIYASGVYPPDRIVVKMIKGQLVSPFLFFVVLQRGLPSAHLALPGPAYPPACEY